MRLITAMPLDQIYISWRPVASGLCLALVLTDRPMHTSRHGQGHRER
jgi:hypothetical protein